VHLFPHLTALGTLICSITNSISQFNQQCFPFMVSKIMNVFKIHAMLGLISIVHAVGMYCSLLHLVGREETQARPCSATPASGLFPEAS
jgi:hypothetical protein